MPEKLAAVRAHTIEVIEHALQEYADAVEGAPVQLCAWQVSAATRSMADLDDGVTGYPRLAAEGQQLHVTLGLTQLATGELMASLRQF